MRALTVHQPWAWAIVEGLKDVENRSQRTHVRERILIHAGKRPPSSPEFMEAVTWIESDGETEVPPGEATVTGAIVGSVEIVDCVQDGGELSDWSEGVGWQWVLAGAVKFATPIPCRGAQGFWKPPKQVVQKAQRHMAREGSNR